MPPEQGKWGCQATIFPSTGGTRKVRISPAAPKVELSTTSRQITAHTGAVLLRATADAIGLGPAIDAELHLKARDRGLSEAESVLGMTEALALGAKCLDDLDVARGGPGAGGDARLRGSPAPDRGAVPAAVLPRPHRP